MIVFNLGCSHGHSFEGWFASAADYETQHSRGLVACPLCGDVHVEKGLSAPRLNLGHAETEDASRTSGSAERSQQHAYLGSHHQVLQQFKAFLLANTDNVGPAFAETARRIHYGEEAHRNIRGRVSVAEADELRDEGIDTMQLPADMILDEGLQ